MKRRMDRETIATETRSMMLCCNERDSGSFDNFSFPAQLYFESGPGMTNRFDIEVRSGDKNPKVVASCAAMSPGNRKVSKGE